MIYVTIHLLLLVFTQFFFFAQIGNGLGTVSGAVQLILYACYYKTTPKDEEEEEDEDEENLSKANSQLQLSGNYGQAKRVSA